MAEPRRVGRVREDYRFELGSEAWERQQAEALVRFDCCGELKEGGHHPLCRKYVEPTVPEIHPDQESLL